MNHDADHDEAAARETAVLQREVAADAREAALTVRELELENKPATPGDRGSKARRILDDADQRDEVSDARDTAADGREEAAFRAAFIDETQGTTSDRQPELRRATALDRRHSKTDRTSAATDRVQLAGEDAQNVDDGSADD